jgi:hypothetical protein
VKREWCMSEAEWSQSEAKWNQVKPSKAEWSWVMPEKCRCCVPISPSLIDNTFVRSTEVRKQLKCQVVSDVIELKYNYDIDKCIRPWVSLNIELTRFNLIIVLSIVSKKTKQLLQEIKHRMIYVWVKIEGICILENIIACPWCINRLRSKFWL